MLDSELIPFIGKFLNEAVSIGFPNIGPFEVIQAAQPTQQGTPSVPTVTFLKYPEDRARGWPMNSWSLVDGKTVEKSVQLYESDVQISSLKWQDPETPNAEVVTASDLLNYLFMAFRMPSTIQRFNAAKVNILRAVEVRNEPFENDNHRFEYHPTFILTLTHSREISAQVPSIVKVEEFVFGV